MTPTDYLTSYYEDLEYQFKNGGMDYVNYNSAGTEYFETDAECAAYLKALKTVIDDTSKETTA